MSPHSSTPQEKELWQDEVADMVVVVKVRGSYIKFNTIGGRELTDLDPKLDVTLTREEFLTKHSLLF